MKQIKTRKKKMQEILKQEPTETNIYIYFFLTNNKLDNILKFRGNNHHPKYPHPQSIQIKKQRRAINRSFKIFNRYL